MTKASDLKKGSIVAIEGAPHLVKDIEVKSPSSRGSQTLYRVRFNNVKTKQKLDRSFTGDDNLDDIDFMRRSMQFLYQEGEMFTFMDTEDYNQFVLGEDAIAEQLPYLTDDIEGLYGLLVEGELLGIELPTTVILEVVETAPGMRGASATNRTKPASLSTGLEVQVPEYLEPGEKIKINTQTGKFMSRG